MICFECMECGARCEADGGYGGEEEVVCESCGRRHCVSVTTYAGDSD